MNNSSFEKNLQTDEQTEKEQILSREDFIKDRNNLMGYLRYVFDTEHEIWNLENRIETEKREIATLDFSKHVIQRDSIDHKGLFYCIFFGLVIPIFLMLIFKSTIVTIIASFFIILAIVGIVVISLQYKKGKKEEVTSYINETKRIAVEKEKEKEIWKRIDSLKKEKKENEELLSNLYDFNIIPMCYRGFFKIGNLIGYMRTSTVSLNEAFRHMDHMELTSNLGSIKSELSGIKSELSGIDELKNEIAKSNKINALAVEAKITEAKILENNLDKLLEQTKNISVDADRIDRMITYSNLKK